MLELFYRFKTYSCNSEVQLRKRKKSISSTKKPERSFKHDDFLETNLLMVLISHPVQLIFEILIPKTFRHNVISEASI